MRRNLITMLLCLLTAVGFAQKEKFLEPDIKAEFPDGVAAMMQFVRDNMKYPKIRSAAAMTPDMPKKSLVDSFIIL